MLPMRSGSPGWHYWLPVGLWMALIFFMSTRVGAPENTSRILVPLLTWLFPDITAEGLALARFAVRKLMHLLEYAILAMLLWRARFRPRRDDSRPWSNRDATFAGLVAVAYAASDEFHQTFVPGRDGTLTDVLIDSAGAALGLTVIWILWRFRRRVP